MSQLASHLRAIFGPIRFREILEIALLLLWFREIGSGRIWPKSGRQSTHLYLLRPLARIIHHICGASLGIRHHSAFASFTNTTSIRSVTKSTVMSNPYAIRSLSGELSRLGSEQKKYSR